MAGWKLLIEDDAGKTITVPLARDEITIGRKEGNTIRLTERNVSRFHARLLRQNGAVFIQDLESYTGIRINGDRIRGLVEVREGDLIEIGDYHLALQAEGAQPALAGTQPPLASSHLTQPLARAPSGELASGEDQFAGDTQRWSPNDAAEPINLLDPGSLPTEEGAVLIETETQRYTTPMLEEPTREEASRIDSAEPTMPGVDMVAGRVPLGPTFGSDDTVRLPSTPLQHAPGLLDSPTLPTAALPAAVLAAAAAPHNGTHGIHEQDTVATAALKPTSSDEHTEAVAVAPGEEGLVQRARLVALNTVFAGTVLPFDGTDMVIGRTDDNDLVIQHKSVSRNHARITSEGERFRIQDLGSANGILLNNEEVGSALLKSGDVVELGRVRLRFVEPGERFTLSAADIERARVADASGEEWDEAGTHVTSPLRDRPSTGAAPKKSPVLYVAVAGGVLVVVAVIVIAMMGGSGGEAETSPSDAPPPTPTRAAAAGPVNDENARAASAKLDEARGYLKGGDLPKAERAANDSVMLHSTPEAEALLVEIRGAQQSAATLERAKKMLGERRFEEAFAEARALAEGSESAEAKKVEEAARGALVERYTADAKAAHDRSDRGAREGALQKLRELDEGKASELELSFAAEDVEPTEVGTEPTVDDDDKKKKAAATAKKPPPQKPREEKAEAKPVEDPEEAKRLEGEAMKLFLGGHAGQAVAYLEKARALDRHRASIHKLLGQAYEKQGKSKQAASAYKTYLALSPGAPDRELVQSKIDQLGK